MNSKKKSILVILLAMTGQTKPLRYWFKVPTGAPAPHYALAVGGPNDKYIIHGGMNDYGVYQIDYSIPQSTQLGLLDIRTNFGSTSSGSELLALNDNYFFFSNKYLALGIYTKLAGLEKQYPVPTDGAFHSIPFSVSNTDFVFAATKSGSPSSLYRVLITSSDAPKIFPLGDHSKCSGSIPDTNFVVASQNGLTTRKVFDYTNGFVGGSGSGATTTHTKADGTQEDISFFSPRNGEVQVYVVAVNTVNKIRTVNWPDGSNRLSRTLPNGISAIAWIPDTTLCIVTFGTATYSVTDFMDQSIITNDYTLPGTGVFALRLVVSKKNKLSYILDWVKKETNIIKLLEEYPCSGLCQECDGIKRDKCTVCLNNAELKPADNTCSCKLNYYAANKQGDIQQCLQCSSLCQECTGGAATQCSSCKYPSIMERKGDGSCGCKEGTYSTGATTCGSCHVLCETCSGPSETECLTCSAFAFMSPSRGCLSCAENESTTCKISVILNVAENLEERNRVLKINMTPSLTLNHPNPSLITAEVLILKHLKITIKKREQESWTSILIDTQKLRHSPTSSELSIRFEQEVKVSEVEKIKVEVNDPLIYKTGPGEPQKKAIYFKKGSHEIQVNEGKEQLNAFSTARGIAAFMSITAASGYFGLLALNACKLIDNISVYVFFRYMNLVDILLAITKVNIELERRVRIVVEFLESLQIPSIRLLERASPIRGTEEGKKDADAYLRLLRGKRGHLVSQNEDMFILTGQNFFITLIILVSFTLMKTLQGCLAKNHMLLKIISHCYHTLISVVFFDFQFICFTELAVSDFEKLSSHSPKFILSWLFSLMIVTLTVFEQVYGGFLIKSFSGQEEKIMKKTTKNQGNELTINEENLIEKYSDGLDEEVSGLAKYFNLIDGVRFTMMLVVVSSLQLMNRAQMVVLVVISLVYLVYVCLLVGLTKKMFESSVIKVKFIVQEFCILTCVLGLCVYTYKKDSAWSGTGYFKIIQTMVPVAIVVAVFLDFFMVVRDVFFGIIHLCHKKTKRSMIIAKGSTQLTKCVQTEVLLVKKIFPKKKFTTRSKN